eukprot:673837-Pyramimonas_sp.AAC.1
MHLQTRLPPETSSVLKPEEPQSDESYKKDPGHPLGLPTCSADPIGKGLPPETFCNSRTDEAQSCSPIAI